MLSLKDLAARVATGSVELRGKRKAAVRLLSAIEVAEFAALMPEPPAPMVPDPRAGSRAPQVPDYEDKGWHAECRMARSRQRAAEAAVSLGWVLSERESGAAWDPGAPAAEKIKWLNAAVDEITGPQGLSDEEIGAVYREARRLESAVDGEALGNS
jgi:hypothetical protein